MKHEDVNTIQAGNFERQDRSWSRDGSLAHLLKLYATLAGLDCQLFLQMQKLWPCMQAYCITLLVGELTLAKTYGLMNFGPPTWQLKIWASPLKTWFSKVFSTLCFMTLGFHLFSSKWVAQIKILFLSQHDVFQSWKNWSWLNRSQVTPSCLCSLLSFHSATS